MCWPGPEKCSTCTRCGRWSPGQLALRRACVRRGGSVIDGNRHLRRLISLARWAFPDVWNGFRGSLPTAVAVLNRWPHLAQLAAARRSTLTAVVALHTRGVADVPDRVEAIGSAAAAWAAFWAGHLDLDALAFDVTEHLTDMADAKARTERATGQAQRYWRQLYGEDETAVGAWHGTGHRLGDPRLPRRRHRVRLGKGS